jgi:hypothetical protein
VSDEIFTESEPPLECAAEPEPPQEMSTASEPELQCVAEPEAPAAELYLYPEPESDSHVHEIQQDVTVNKAQTQDKMYSKWDEYVRG